MPERFPGRLALQQRVLPAYRAPFFDALAKACEDGLSVFAGEPLPVEHISVTDKLAIANFVPARNRHFSHPGSRLYQCWQSGLLEWLDASQPDALIVEATPRYLSTPRAVRWMHTRGKPVLGWGLGAPIIGGLLGFLRRKRRRSFLLSLDGVVAYSQRGAQEYINEGFAPERVYIAPNAVAPRPKVSPPRRPDHFHKRPKVLFVGRLQARKRIDNLLLACAALPGEIQPELWIVGEGPAREQFQELAQEVYPRAQFMGAKYGEALEEYFMLADIFVLPGTGGLAVQQAMAYGLPVIVAQGDGTQDDLVRPENGWQVPPNDPTALRTALESALSNPPRLRVMGEASFRIVTEEVNLEYMVEVFLNALSTLSA